MRGRKGANCYYMFRISPPRFPSPPSPRAGRDLTAILRGEETVNLFTIYILHGDLILLRLLFKKNEMSLTILVSIKRKLETKKKRMKENA